MSRARLPHPGADALWLGARLARADPSRARHRTCLGAVLALALSATPPAAAPESGEDPARARVAAQCAAFWEGAGAPDRAAPFRALARAEGADSATTQARIARLQPAMTRLARDRLTSDRAARLWARHAALCSPKPAVD